SGGHLAGHAPRLNRPPDSLAKQRRCMTRCIADPDDPVARALFDEPFGRNEPGVMLHRLSAAKIHSEARGFGHQPIQVVFRIVARIGMNHANTNAHSPASPWAYPRVTGWRHLAADNQHGLALIALWSVQVVFRADAEALEPRVETGLLQQQRSIAG